MAVEIASDAAGWPARWIAHPHDTVGEQVWFCRSFTGEGRAVAGQIEMAVSCGAVLYVNGYNVTADDGQLAPNNVPLASAGGWPRTVMVTRYDVTRFLRPDTNVVAVWCAPEARLSLVFSGLRVTHGGRRAAPFSYTTDATWLCRTGGRCISADGREIVDGRETKENWRTGDVEVTGWLNVREITAGEEDREAVGDDYKIVEVAPLHKVVRVGHIHECCLTDVTAGRLTYSCGRGFRGRLRVTLRGMGRGDVIDIGGMTYICSGESDEQAVMRLTEHTGDSVVISGSKSLSPANVQSVEALSFEEYFHDSWMF